MPDDVKERQPSLDALYAATTKRHQQTCAGARDLVQNHGPESQRTFREFWLPARPRPHNEREARQVPR